jgi:hypothetical protein
MTSLTDRYVAATLRSIPPAQRADIELELRAAIADAEEGQGEVAALTELGHPDRLAAAYSERPLHLIGPALFLDYRRVLVVLLSSVVPLIFLAAAIANFRADAGLGSALLAAANSALVVALHLAVWTTLVFALIERSPSMRARRTPWDPASLPELPARRIDLGSIIGGSAVTAAIAAVLVVLQTTTGGVIDPTLWNSGALLVVVVFAAVAIAFDVIAYYVGWRVPQALASLLLTVLFTGAVVVAVRGGLLNPAYFDGFGWPAGTEIVGWIIIAVVVLLGLGSVSTAFRRIPTKK